MEEKKLEEQKITVKKGKFLKWLDNYWYHYKWPTIVVAFFVVVLSVCLIQSWTTEEKDILITYAGSETLEPDDKAAIETVLSDTLPEGFGHKGADGKAGFITYIIYSKEQIKQAEADKVFVDTVFNGSEYDSLQTQFQAGSGSIYILEKWLYDEILEGNPNIERLKPLSEIFGETPEGAIDAYGIRLGDTAIYQSNPALKALPADSIICLHEQIMGQKDYEKEVEAFKEIAKMAESADGK